MYCTLPPEAERGSVAGEISQSFGGDELREDSMDTTTPQPSESEEARQDELADRIYKATIAAFELLHIYVGERLGLYRSLSTLGPATA
ncbi:MAG TPA: hypothetical protein VII47_13240, partial [Actinomycetota bacterium]